MTISEILAKPFDKALVDLTADPGDKDKSIDDNRKAFDGKHEILDDPNRRPRVIGSGETSRTVKYTTETVPYQRIIVNSAVTFLFGEPVSLMRTDGDKTAFELVLESWKRNKLDYFNKTLARDLFVECKAAELWSIPPKVPGVPARLRVMLLSRRTGYRIYPHFDEYGDMDAFTVRYDTVGADSRTVEHADVYVAGKVIQGTHTTGDWKTEERTELFAKLVKIPIVYYEQDRPEWESVSTEINRLEYLLSNFADANDYFGSPLLQIKGAVTNLPRKEDVGKVIMVAGETDADGKVYYPGGAEFITWDRMPEAIKMEYDMLKDVIFGMTQTPDLSFSNVKGMTNMSGIALRLMFSDALFKARDKQEVFGPAMERRLSIMRKMLGLVNVSKAKALDELDIDIAFNDVLPQDVETLIKSLSVARGGEPIMSEESAVRINPLVTDAEKDIEILTGEKAAIRSFAESYT